MKYLKVNFTQNEECKCYSNQKENLFFRNPLACKYFKQDSIFYPKTTYTDKAYNGLYN